MTLRDPAVAGTFYPDQPGRLLASIETYLTDSVTHSPGQVPKAMIVPHAGYIYSGPVAGRAYALLRQGRDTIRRVILLGPAHRVLVRGLALPEADGFTTPLGTVYLDEEGMGDVMHLPQVSRSTAAHALEHSLEVQLPFLQAVLDDFRILPFAVGSASPRDVREVIDVLWGGPETLILVSSDLSHYHTYREAQAIDGETARKILDMSVAIDHEQACGATPINGLLLAARARGVHAQLLDLRNSGDTAGDRHRVVGYASFAFIEGDAHD